MTATDTAPPVAPAPPRGNEYRPWPKWQRRAVIAVVLVLAFAVLIVAGKRNVVGQEAKDLDPVVVGQLPPPDGRALRQTQVGAELKIGYDGRLTINGVRIPEEQMDGAIDPTSVSPGDLRRFGIRPNKRNSVFFTPGPGKVIESLDTGSVTIALRYFKDKQAGTTGRTITWTIDVA